MPRQDEFPAIFARLRSVLQPFAPNLRVTQDTQDSYALDAPASADFPMGLFFGKVEVRKNYVSYYLMPVYIFPDLLDGVSDALRKRMQGKSCFNFTRHDDALAAELARLTRAGYERYAEQQLL